MCLRLERHLGLVKGKLDLKWSELSGGQRQRAVIGVGLALCLTASDRDTLQLLPDEDRVADHESARPKDSLGYRCLLLLDEVNSAAYYSLNLVLPFTAILLADSRLRPGDYPFDREGSARIRLCLFLGLTR